MIAQITALTGLVCATGTACLSGAAGDWRLRFMSAKRARALVFGRVWRDSQEERQPLARTPDERTTACFREFAPRITRVLQHMFTGRHDVEDAVQDAFLRLHEAFGRDEEIDNVGAWVYMVAKNQLICGVRRTHRQEKTYKHALAVVAKQSMDDAGVTPEDIFIDRSRGEALREAMASLSELERQCLLARADGLTLAEVGRVVALDLRRVSEIVRGAVLKLQQRNLNG